jgi:aryl-phospho-beta-D-glucosidase BglC (GH1 family)
MRDRLIGILLIIAVFLFSCSEEEASPDNGNKDPITPISIDLHKFSQDHKGFNLLGKFDVNWSNYGFTEEEFIIIQDLGFNFVRLPLDYRTYTETGDWNVFLENEIAKIDQVIEWGKQYGVHICINLHRAPGYCVNESTLPANQDLNLWTNTTAQDAFVNHWAFFAERYIDESYADVSFNLVNEPDDVDESTYVQVMQKAIDKIHEINPNRIVFVDGLSYARELIMPLKNENNIIQAIHVYDPFTLTHYKAGWVNGSDTWPVPIWPILDISNYLYGPVKAEFQSSLIFEGDFAQDTEIIINVQQVSIESTLQIKLDDVEIYSKEFICGPDLGEDWTVINLTQWGYQNISGKDYGASLPTNGNKLTISNIEGDWMTINRITIKSGNSEITVIPGNTSWGSMQDAYKITSEGEITNVDGEPIIALGSLKETLDLAETEQIPVMVGEFGVYNKTPHDVTLAYLSDVVTLFNSYQIGYTLWNLTGSFGIIDSERSDCTYTSYRGKQLDQELTDILQGN